MNEKYPNIEIGHIVVSSVMGSTYGYALRDALRLAVNEWRNVTLLHNGRESRIYVNRLIDAVELPEDSREPDA